MKPDIKSMLPDEIEKEFQLLGEPRFRAKQVFTWLGRGVRSFDEMTDLSKALRLKLAEKYTLAVPRLIGRQESKTDGTMKFLWELSDGNAIETVVMSYKHGNTVCISSQAGCRMGCAFCASAIGGLIRNLEPSEMLDEVIFSELAAGMPISNVVLMGIGEPLDNFDNVIKFLKLVNHPGGKNVGMRHISLSTCGLTEKFDKLGELNLQLTLSVSLHAPDDETRSRLMSVNKRGGVDGLLSACGRYFEQTGRRISFEYAMIDGVNDAPEHALKLALRLKNTGGHVNLIPMNHVSGREFKPSSHKRIVAFAKILQEKGINVTIRRSLGADVDAACGQLRRRAMAERN